jgi:hypothetical protein
MQGTTKGLLDSFEMIVVHTCAKHIQPMLPFPFIVHVLSENQQKAWRVRFAYGMYHDGQFAPCG